MAKFGAAYQRTRTTYVAVLCALFAAGGYFLGRTVAAPDAKPLDRTAIETADRTAATAPDVKARENTMATVGTDQSTSAETPSRPIAQPSATPDRPPVVLLNPNTAQRSKEVGRASAGPVPAQEEPDDRGEGRKEKPAKEKKSVITKKPNRPVDEYKIPPDPMPTTLALRFRAPRLQTTIFVTNRAATATTVISGVPCCAGNSDEAPCKPLERQSSGLDLDPAARSASVVSLEKLLAISANFS